MAKCIRKQGCLAFFTAMASLVFLNAADAQQNQIKTVPGAKLISVEKLVPTGSDQKIQFIANSDPDCTPLPNPVVRVIAKLQHGNIDFTDFEDFGYWTAPNVREKCNDKKIKGLRVGYKSDDGFTGDDKATILFIFSDSSAHQYNFLIHVW